MSRSATSDGSVRVERAPYSAEAEAEALVPPPAKALVHLGVDTQRQAPTTTAAATTTGGSTTAGGPTTTGGATTSGGDTTTGGTTSGGDTTTGGTTTGGTTTGGTTTGGTTSGGDTTTGGTTTGGTTTGGTTTGGTTSGGSTTDGSTTMVTTTTGGTTTGASTTTVMTTTEYQTTPLKYMKVVDVFDTTTMMPPTTTGDSGGTTTPEPTTTEEYSTTLDFSTTTNMDFYTPAPGHWSTVAPEIGAKNAAMQAWDAQAYATFARDYARQATAEVKGITDVLNANLANGHLFMTAAKKMYESAALSRQAARAAKQMAETHLDPTVRGGHWMR